MRKIVKNLLVGAASVIGGTSVAIACTGVSFTAVDGSYVQARTIEWAKGALQSEYVVIPRGTFAVLTYSVDGLRVDKHDIPIA